MIRNAAALFFLHTIIIDPGHGGIDPGTHGLFSKEKTVALSISLKLGKALHKEYPELNIVYTRTTDQLPGNKLNIRDGIRYRAELANREHGDLFICIHCNSNGQPPGRFPVKEPAGYRTIGKGKKRHKVPVYVTRWITNNKTGTATYVWKADRSVPKGAAISQRNSENMGDTDNSAYDLSTPEARMSALLYEKKYFANSALFGTLVQDAFKKAGRRSEGVLQRQIGIGVLQATGMPSVLIETGYLTNKEEERYLNSKAGQDQVVSNIMTAFRQYIKVTAGEHPGTKNVNGTTTPKGNAIRRE
ncbi:MAG TPA: N-acetylmuramoyl-L-alanine amidase [Puia sp.]|jgi:N-acetylmuramoyl-L-alanine amidase|nr:N-acetylmuramoyl-L-alanine amidase [Puia sp.]